MMLETLKSTEAGVKTARPVIFVAMMLLAYNSWMDTGPGVPAVQRMVYGLLMRTTSPPDGAEDGFFCAELTPAKTRKRVQMATEMLRRCFRAIVICELREHDPIFGDVNVAARSRNVPSTSVRVKVENNRDNLSLRPF